MAVVGVDRGGKFAGGPSTSASVDVMAMDLVVYGLVNS